MENGCAGSKSVEINDVQDKQSSNLCSNESDSIEAAIEEGIVVIEEQREMVDKAITIMS